MEPELARQLWVEALRSGEYKQGTCVLHDPEPDDSYCCLGVGCEVYQKHVGDLKITTSGGMKKYDGEFTTLPTKVARWLNIRCAGAAVGDHTGLVMRNDMLRHDFNQIADFIESGNLLTYEE